MPDPEFQSPDGRAATVLVAALIAEMMDNALAQRAANLVIDVFGLEGRERRG